MINVFFKMLIKLYFSFIKDKSKSFNKSSQSFSKCYKKYPVAYSINCSKNNKYRWSRSQKVFGKTFYSESRC